MITGAAGLHARDPGGAGAAAGAAEPGLEAYPPGVGLGLGGGGREVLRPDAGPRLLGVGSDLCWPPRPPAVGPEGLHELAQKVVALCAVTERALEGLPAAAADALAGRQWQGLAERERALQRRCVELDERERQMELAFGQLDELRRHSLDLLVGLDRRSQAAQC